VLALSRGTGIVLHVLCILFLVYQLKTHPHVFETEGLGEEEPEGPGIGSWILASTLLVVTVAVSFCSDYLVGSIDAVVISLGISKTMVGNAGIPKISSSDR